MCGLLGMIAGMLLETFLLIVRYEKQNIGEKKIRIGTRKRRKQHASLGKMSIEQMEALDLAERQHGVGESKAFRLKQE